MILPSLQQLAVPIGDLRPMERNPRRGDVEAVMRSFDRFGQRKPIVARTGTGEIIAGNHAFMAAKRLGWAEIAVVFVDDDDTTAKAFALADNRTSELGGWDNEMLAEIISEVLADDQALLEAASYQQSDLEKLIAETTAEAEADLPVPESRQAPIKLADRFLGLPVSVLNSREGWWQERKRAWTNLGIESELGRDGKALTWNLALPPGHGHQATDLVQKEQQ